MHQSPLPLPPHRHPPRRRPPCRPVVAPCPIFLLRCCPLALRRPRPTSPPPCGALRRPPASPGPRPPPMPPPPPLPRPSRPLSRRLPPPRRRARLLPCRCHRPQAAPRGRPGRDPPPRRAAPPALPSRPAPRGKGAGRSRGGRPRDQEEAADRFCRRGSDGRRGGGDRQGDVGGRRRGCRCLEGGVPRCGADVHGRGVGGGGSDASVRVGRRGAEVEGESKVEVVEQEGFAGGGDDRRGGAGMAEDGVGEAGVGGGRHGVFGERMRAGLQVAGQRQSHAPQRYHSRHLKMSFE
ncbi:unnamed protein product [Musa acuminata subsp. malaccensis]|uniref:(wild Malaysian banana) hypothetical protein n=1 Tax=Musa acuminata subsp. malaccensis TaxID=214687 RepID=A0A8D6ZL42_MUSAM|nr:unnamed protein product [Musa acuminata subsp. malaccensis]